MAACLALGSVVGVAHAAADAPGCTASAGPDCYRSFQPPGAGGTLNYYASLAPGAAAPTRVLIGMHGHPRDADKTFNAALLAVRNAGALDDTLVVAPVFQVAADKARKCSAPGVPAAEAGDLLWTCGSWLEGGPAENGARVTSFAAMDALVAELTRRWPGLRTVTIAGFSAGAQMVQHYIGFAKHEAGATPVAVRYVVADPGTWLYFDAWRPQPVTGAECPAVNRWKYGTDNLPAHLGRNAAQARAHSPAPTSATSKARSTAATPRRVLRHPRQVVRGHGAGPVPHAARPGLRAVRPDDARARPAPRSRRGAGLRARRGVRLSVRGRARRVARHAALKPPPTSRNPVARACPRARRRWTRRCRG
ncbi:hypothetical protein [Variovorax sp. E3]|uniref:hypothetical protein n=1 Tax=Variovorax sp. E3 TaxID=1914993 RepID=UPI0022B63B6A|nr:hypothetical protein [Variovorax sp. E3]